MNMKQKDYFIKLLQTMNDKLFANSFYTSKDDDVPEVVNK